MYYVSCNTYIWCIFFFFVGEMGEGVTAREAETPTVNQFVQSPASWFYLYDWQWCETHESRVMQRSRLWETGHAHQQKCGHAYESPMQDKTCWDTANMWGGRVEQVTENLKSIGYSTWDTTLKRSMRPPTQRKDSQFPNLDELRMQITTAYETNAESYTIHQRP